MFNQFQQRLAYLGFTSCPITAEEYDMLLAAGLEDAEIEGIASDIAAGFSLQGAFELAVFGEYD